MIFMSSFSSDLPHSQPQITKIIQRCARADSLLPFEAVQTGSERQPQQGGAGGEHKQEPVGSFSLLGEKPDVSVW